MIRGPKISKEKVTKKKTGRKMGHLAECMFQAM